MGGNFSQEMTENHWALLTNKIPTESPNKSGRRWRAAGTHTEAKTITGEEWSDNTDEGELLC